MGALTLLQSPGLVACDGGAPGPNSIGMELVFVLIYGCGLIGYGVMTDSFLVGTLTPVDFDECLRYACSIGLSGETFSHARASVSHQLAVLSDPRIEH